MLTVILTLLLNVHFTIVSKTTHLIFQDACNKLKERLQPIREANPKGTWEQWVKAAYFKKVNLTVSGFYASEEDTSFNREQYTGDIFDYFVSGAACSLVEIDTLTGDHQVLTTDIVMDVGKIRNKYFIVC